MSLSYIPPTIASASTTTSVECAAHVQKQGWQHYVSTNKLIGTTGKRLRLEGVKIKTVGDADLGIEYSSHVEGIGWQKYVKDNELSGTTGQKKRLEAIKIKLTGKHADQYDIYYRAHVQNLGWLDWAKNGEPAGTTGYGYRLEGLEIQLITKGSNSPNFGGTTFKEKTISTNINTSLIDGNVYDKNNFSITGNYRSSSPIKKINIYINNKLTNTIAKDNFGTQGTFNTKVDLSTIPEGNCDVRTEIIDQKKHSAEDSKHILISPSNQIINLEDTFIENNMLHIKGNIKTNTFPIKQIQVYIDNIPIDLFRFFPAQTANITKFNKTVNNIGMVDAGMHTLTIESTNTNGQKQSIQKEIEIEDFASEFEIIGDTPEKQAEFRSYYNKFLKDTKIEKLLSSNGYKIYLYDTETFKKSASDLEYNVIAYTSFPNPKMCFNGNDDDREYACVHEIGHALDISLGSAIGKPYLSMTDEFDAIFKEEGLKLYYSTSHYMENAQEYFAGAFNDYFRRPDIEKTKAPKTYAFMDKYVSLLVNPAQ